MAHQREQHRRGLASPLQQPLVAERGARNDEREQYARRSADQVVRIGIRSGERGGQQQLAPALDRLVVAELAAR